MLEIDFFKNINDTFGHTSGDAYLRELGQVMLRHTREGDIACRYGGEEFTVILPGASLEATSQRAEELRRGAAEIRVVLHGRELPRVTISAGVAAFPRHGPSWEEVLARADEALYRAKEAGRDRVVEAASHPVAVVKALPLQP